MIPPVIFHLDEVAGFSALVVAVDCMGWQKASEYADGGLWCVGEVLYPYPRGKHELSGNGIKDLVPIVR